MLTLLFSSPEKSFYLREIIRSASVGRGSIQREVKNLCDVGIIHRTLIGNQTHYQANRDLPVYNELRSFVMKTSGLAGLIERSLRNVDGIDSVLIYGSAASGRDTADSDVDLLIVGNVKLSIVSQAMAVAEKKLARVVNPTIYRKSEFKKKIEEKNHFLTTVMKNPREVIFDECGHFEYLED